MIVKNVFIAGSGNVTGMNVIRALLGNKDISLYGCDYEAINPSNQWCPSYSVPRCAEEGYETAIMKIVKEKKISHIIATNDHDVRALSLIKEKSDKFPTFNGFSKNILNCLDKKETLKLFLRAGVKTPQEVGSNTDYPYVLRKESMGNKKKFVHIVKSDTDLSEIPKKHFEDGIKTRYISGIEYTVDVLCDNNSEVISAIPRRRIEVIGGMVHHAQIDKDLTLINLCSKIAKSVGLTGMNCIQCIKNEEEYYFIEINPRPGSGIDLSIASGINMPLLWIKDSLGESYSMKEPEWGLQMKRFYSGYYYKNEE